MSAEIVYLSPRSARSTSPRVTCPARGFVFPDVFRGQGYEGAVDFVDGRMVAVVDERGKMKRSDKLGLVFYTLADQDGDYGYFDCRFENLTRMDPERDSVSLIVRHHDTSEAAHAYWAGWYDLGGISRGESRIFGNESGYFTLLPVPTRPWWPGPLLIYSAMVPYDPDMGVMLEAAGRAGLEVSTAALVRFAESMKAAGETVVWTLAIGPDGKPLDDYSEEGGAENEWDGLVWGKVGP